MQPLLVDNVDGLPTVINETHRNTDTVRLQPFSFRQAIIAEFFGTFVLITVGCGAIMASSEIQSAFDSSGLISVAMGFGFMVALIGRSFGHVSGAHLNPAVSLACYVTGRLSVDRLVAYCITQYVASFAACGLLYAVVPHALERTMGATILAHDVSDWQAAVIEVVITFNLVFFAFAVSDRAASPESAGMAPVLTGLVLAAQIFFCGTSDWSEHESGSFIWTCGVLQQMGIALGVLGWAIRGCCVGRTLLPPWISSRALTA